MARAKFRKSKSPNATGRNDQSRFARLDHRILHSNAYRALSPNDRALLVELISMHNGTNNGSLYLSVRDAADRMGVADVNAARRSFDTLQDLGFIELACDAHFSVKAGESSRARCWRLTWLPGPNRKAPSWSFLDREPAPQTKARKRMERGLKAIKAYRKARESGRLPVLDSDTINPFLPASTLIPVLESNTLIDRNGGNEPNCSVRLSNTHIATTIG